MGSKGFKNSRLNKLNDHAWRYYLRFYRGFTGKMGLSVVLSIVQSLFVLPIAFFIQYEIDELIPSANFTLMILVGLVIVLFYLISGGLNLWTRYIILDISKVVIQRIRDELLNKYYTFSRSYYTRTDRSRLHTIMVQDTERLDVMTNAIFSQLLPGIFSSFVLSIVLIYLNWFLYLILFVTIPVLLFISRTIGIRVKAKTLAFHRSFETFSQGILFVLYMMDLTRLQTAEEFEIDKQREYFEDLRLTSAQMAWLKSAHNHVQNAVIAIAGVIILIVGGYAVARGFMTLGALLSFTAVVALLRPQLQMVTTAIPSIIQGNESLNTLYRQMTSADVRPYSGTQKIDFKGLVSLQSVTFRYKDLVTLEDITLSLHPGEMVALIGPNGSGKTTVVNLLLGFYCPEEGQLFADRIPYDNLDIVDLRRQIGVVPQNPLLFHGSVLENITYGDKSLNRDEVIKAAQFASVDEFIDQLPDGYSTHIGEYGVLLSGGQSQRIALARAIIRQPKLLILDEPTNHLDTASVGALIKNLKTMIPSPACLLISHDKSIASVADRIIMMESGRITNSTCDLAEINKLERVKDGMPGG